MNIIIPACASKFLLVIFWESSRYFPGSVRVQSHSYSILKRIGYYMPLKWPYLPVSFYLQNNFFLSFIYFSRDYQIPLRWGENEGKRILGKKRGKKYLRAWAAARSVVCMYVWVFSSKSARIFPSLPHTISRDVSVTFYFSVLFIYFIFFSLPLPLLAACLASCPKKPPYYVQRFNFWFEDWSDVIYFYFIALLSSSFIFGTF